MHNGNDRRKETVKLKDGTVTWKKTPDPRWETVFKTKQEHVRHLNLLNLKMGIVKTGLWRVSSPTSLHKTRSAQSLPWRAGCSVPWLVVFLIPQGWKLQNCPR